MFELLYQEILEKTEDKARVATWTFTIYLMMWNFLSLLVGPLCQLQSHRWTCSIGILLMGLGVILSIFVQTSTDLYLSVGLIVGSGQGLVTNTAILILVDQFGSQQGLALGISFMVMAIGGIVCPQLVRGLLIHFSTKVSIGIFASIVLIGLLGSATFKKAKPIVLNEEEAASALDNQQNPIVKMFYMIEWNLIKDPHFILTVLGSSYSFNALFSFFLYLPLHATAIGLSLNQKVPKENMHDPERKH